MTPKKKTRRPKPAKKQQPPVSRARARAQGSRNKPVSDPFRLPALSLGREEPSKETAWRYLTQAMLMEDWLREGGKGKLPVEDLPVEHRYMLLYWPHAFEFYRLHLFEYLERVLGLSPWNMVARSVLFRLREMDSKGFEAFQKVAYSERDRFSIQRGNAIRRYLESIAAQKDDDRRRELEAILTAYAHVYEIDYSLWYLGVLGQAFSSSKFKVKSFGGPESKTDQGALIEQVATALKKTPFEGLFSYSYDKDLRNAAQHNSYEIREEKGKLIVHDLDTGREWDAKLVNTLLLNSIQLMQAISICVEYEREADLPRRQGEYADCGLISVYGEVTTDDAPELILFQLWCFYEVDPFGTWLDRATARVKSEGKGVERIEFTDHGILSGEPVAGTPLGDALAKQGWGRVHRVPAAPSLDLGYPSYVRPDGAEYEVLGPGDEHLVSFVFETSGGKS